MRKKFYFWEICAGIFICIVGSLMHFVYFWSGSIPWIGTFAAVNESTWEHLKLAFWPALLFAIFEFFFIRYAVNNYWIAKATSLFVTSISIVVLFYTYSGIIGSNYLFIDIAIFVIAVVIGEIVCYRIFKKNKFTSLISTFIAILAILLLATCFIVFTSYPPDVPLFIPPKR